MMTGTAYIMQRNTPLADHVADDGYRAVAIATATTAAAVAIAAITSRSFSYIHIIVPNVKLSYRFNLHRYSSAHLRRHFEKIKLPAIIIT